MKKYALPLILAVFALSSAASASTSTSTTTSNTKTQHDNTSKNTVGVKYNFTLFSFFNQGEKVKTDTSSARTSASPDNRTVRKD